MKFRRRTLSLGFTCAAGLLMLTALIMRPMALYAQEDETLTVEPPADDDPGEGSWDAVSAPDPDSSSGQVLELPQTSVADNDSSTPPPAPSIAADDTAATTAANNAADLSDYTSEGTMAGAETEQRLVSPPVVISAVRAPVPFVANNYPLPTIPNNYVVPAVPNFYAVPAAPNVYGLRTWNRIGMARPPGPSPFPVTSPMLSVPRGSHPVLGGWWQRTR